MSTLTQMRVRFREVLSMTAQTDVDEGDPPKTTITKLLNEARQRRYMGLVTSYPRKFLTRATMVYPSGSESVVLPTVAQGRMVSMVTVVPYGGTAADAKEIVPKAFDELFKYDSSGLAEAYAIDLVSKSIWVRPVPSSDTTIMLYYVAKLVDLSADADEPTEIPSEFHQLFVYDAAAQALREQGSQDSERYAAIGDTVFEDLKRYVERSYQDSGARKRAGLAW